MDAIQEIKRRYAGTRGLFGDENRNISGQNEFSTSGPGIGAAWNAWQNSPVKMSEAATQALRNRLATQATAGVQGYQQRLGDVAARQGFGGTAAVGSLMGQAERGALAGKMSAQTNVDIENERMGIENAMRKAAGLSGLGTAAESLRLQRESNDRAMERFYQEIAAREAARLSEQDWRSKVYGDQLARTGMLDERYLQERGREWGIQDEEIQRQRERQDFEYAMTDPIVRAEFEKFVRDNPQLFRPNQGGFG